MAYQPVLRHKQMAVSLCSGGWTNKAKHKKEVPNINMNLKKQRFHKLLLFILLIVLLVSTRRKKR